jgi:DNA repair/transcription protein MET18/MMS19
MAVMLLITFFGAMFSVDHKTGILPAAKSLVTICTMKSFSHESSNDIIRSVCALGDDFARQPAGTRLAIYELLYLLVADPEVCSYLQYQHGAAAGFMTDIIRFCRNERDPKNLMLWFSILETFLKEYSPSADVTLDMFDTFSSYFPIALRASQHPSGLTAADLKGALRRCFTAHDRVSEHVVPYLIKRLDQPEGNTVDIKVSTPPRSHGGCELTI